MVYIDKFPLSAWKALKEEAEKSLGNDFWNDLNDIMPIFGPRIDVYQTADFVVVAVELPGLESPEQVTVNLTNHHILQIKGQIPPDHPLEGRYLVKSERFTGEFDKKVQLPEQVSAKEVKATYRQGLLSIYLAQKTGAEEQNINLEFTGENPVVQD